LGHTFLLLRRAKASDVAVEYTADTDTDSPLL
jgi:hypothetical protein